MKKDLIFDAMDYIDDDMLEDVNALRSRRSAGRNRMLVRYASAAACICIVIAGVFAASRFGLYNTHDSAESLHHNTAEDKSETCITENLDGESPTETGAAENETLMEDDDASVITDTASAVPDSLDFSSLDVSAVKSIRLHCGYNGETVWVTDPDDIAEITDCVLQIRCDSPESSRGYYGWSFGIYLYNTEYPADDTKALWYGSMFSGKMYSEYLYETVSGHSYYALYRMTGITTEEIDAVCEKHFPSLADFSGMNSP